MWTDMDDHGHLNRQTINLCDCLMTISIIYIYSSVNCFDCPEWIKFLSTKIITACGIKRYQISIFEKCDKFLTFYPTKFIPTANPKYQ